MTLNQLTAALLAAGMTTSAMAGGFALTEQSVSAMGSANAGRASTAQDASVTYNNPAGMVKLRQAQASGSVAVIDASSRISNVNAPLGGTNDGDMVPLTYIPSAHFTSGNQGRWAWGVSTYGSFGLKTNYESTFAGRHLGDKSSVKVTTLQPAVSFAVNDRVRVGGGLTFNYLEAYLSKNLSSVPNVNPNPPPVLPGTVLGTTALKGNDYGYGYNLGVQADLDPVTTAGLVYRSKVAYKINDGTLTTTGTGIGPGTGAGTYGARTSLDTPESVDLSLSRQVSNRTTVHAGATWTRWSRLQALNVETTHPLVGTTSETFNWKDSTAYAVGLSHACSDKLELRAGLAYDNSPVSPENRSVRLPSADRRIATLGLGYKHSPTQSVDLSYAYLDEEKATVRQAASAYSADYHNSANIFGVQFNQKF